MCRLCRAALFLLGAVVLSSFAAPPESASRSVPPETRSRVHQSVTGPTSTINQALAAGATATITLQPVAPKTLPASSYPPGSTIVGSTLTLGSVPARVWFEAHITGWAPDVLKTFQIKVDANDNDQDGGGYYQSECGGAPVIGEGNIFPAIQPCAVNSDCRVSMSGIASPCQFAEPSRCINRPFFFPPGGKVCENGFFDGCDPQFFGSGLQLVMAFDYATINARWGVSFEQGEVPFDFAPSYAGTLVLDVPANAKGTYHLDYAEAETFMQNPNTPPDNDIPIAALNEAVIRTTCGSCCTNPGGQLTCTDGLSQVECDALPTNLVHTFRPGTTCADADCCDCQTSADCDDGDGCTADTCQESCYCIFTPVATWDQATECCDPATGVQALKPPSNSCNFGECSLGGSSGSPMVTPRPDGTVCSDDPCYDEGQCSAGQCIATQHAGANCPKSRFISFDISTGSTPSAYRIRMVSLHHPDPPYTGGPTTDFSAFEGLYRWVGAPSEFVESTANSTPVYAAMVGCDPHYQDWSAIDLLHVGGAEIVPSSVYEIQSIAEGLDINVESNYSAPTSIVTSRWCDVVIPYSPPSTSEQPDFGDVAAMVNKFRSLTGAISKPRALLVGEGASGIPVLGINVDFSHISAVVDAFRNKPYPFAGPVPCP